MLKGKWPKCGSNGYDDYSAGCSIKKSNLSIGENHMKVGGRHPG